MDVQAEMPKHFHSFGVRRYSAFVYVVVQQTIWFGHIMACGRLLGVGMQETPLIQRSLELVCRLCDEHSWNLTDPMRNQYAIRIAALSRIDSVDAELGRTITNYHHDHVLVEALADQRHPEHDAAWDAWKKQATALLFSKFGQSPSNDVMLSFEDMLQEALSDVWGGIDQFQYTSRFNTWAFQVMIHCFLRQIRRAETHKRSANARTESLDDTAALDYVLVDRHQDTLEQQVFNQALHSFVGDILATHSNKNVSKIFHQWYYEEQTYRKLATEFNLSPSWIHGTMKHVLTLLQTMLIESGWVERRTAGHPRPI